MIANSGNRSELVGHVGSPACEMAHLSQKNGLPKEDKKFHGNIRILGEADTPSLCGAIETETIN